MVAGDRAARPSRSARLIPVVAGPRGGGSGGSRREHHRAQSRAGCNARRHIHTLDGMVDLAHGPAAPPAASAEVNPAPFVYAPALGGPAAHACAKHPAALVDGGRAVVDPCGEPPVLAMTR